MRLLAIASLFLFLSACSVSKTSETASSESLLSDLKVYRSQLFKPLSVNEIAVYPLVSANIDQIEAEDLRSLTGLLVNSLELNTSLAIKESDQNYSNTVADNVSEKALAYGRSLGVQGVIYGVVYDFFEGGSSRIGGENQSNVGFEIWLKNPERDVVLWSARYHKEEKPLSDNILRMSEVLKSGVVYHSRAELAKRGFQRAAQALESSRQSAIPK